MKQFILSTTFIAVLSNSCATFYDSELASNSSFIESALESHGITKTAPLLEMLLKNPKDLHFITYQLRENMNGYSIVSPRFNSLEKIYLTDSGNLVLKAKNPTGTFYYRYQKGSDLVVYRAVCNRNIPSHLKEISHLGIHLCALRNESQKTGKIQNKDFVYSWYNRDAALEEYYVYDFKLWKLGARRLDSLHIISLRFPNNYYSVSEIYEYTYPFFEEPIKL